MAIAKALYLSALFDHLARWETDIILRKAVLRPFEENEVLFKEGEKLDSLIIVAEGKVSVRKNLSSGPFLVQVINSGDFYGENIFLAPSALDISLEGDEAGVVVQVPFDSIVELYRKKPKIYGIFLTNLCLGMGNKMNECLGLVYRLKREGQARFRTPMFDFTRTRKIFSEGERDEFLENVTELEKIKKKSA